MSGIDPQTMSHHLAVKTEAKPVAQSRRKMSKERAEEVARQTASLLEIPMHQPDEETTTFITPGGMYCYKVMPFGSKNAVTTYQRLMNKIFKDLIGKTVEVYVDDILVKTTKAEDLISDLETVFASLWQHGMRLDPLKCAFAVEAGKFLGFMITQRGVEANPEKSEAILQMKSSGCIKDIQRLAGRLTALSCFLGALAAKALPFFNLMKKGIVFEWTPACEEAVKHFKEIISASPVLGKPKSGEALYLYLAITDEAVATVLTATILPKTPDNRQDGPSNPPMSNNQAKYEALLGGLVLAREVGATRVEVCSNSQVVTSQINGTYQARDSLLQKYLDRVKKLSEEFDEITMQHVPRERNTRADLLSKLASTKPRTGNRPLIQGLLKELTVTLHITWATESPSWVNPIMDFLEKGKLLDDDKMTKALRREAAKYTIIQGQLFKKGLSQPLLKCLRPNQTDYVLREVHEECCGHHIRGKALA
ncbi:uncharacterized protein [Arachis hypogaea]|uniref:uncharacterized protein n=1 Tax=Arachis hypogaea TaxID=3818 RepID=UPI003B20E85D